MANSAVVKYLAKIGRKGGKRRLETMTAEQRRAVATKASLAAANARRAKAQKDKRDEG